MIKTMETINVEITNLEDLGWDFSYIYEEVSKAKSISYNDAVRFEKDNYYVKLYKDGNKVNYSLCQKPHYGNEEFFQGDTGDNKLACNDFNFLVENDYCF